jgi:hypothetical protein
MSPAASRATTDLRIHATHTSGDFRAFYDVVCGVQHVHVRALTGPRAAHTVQPCDR